jgi:hypothetical protein
VFAQASASKLARLSQAIKLILGYALDVDKVDDTMRQIVEWNGVLSKTFF